MNNFDEYLDDVYGVFEVSGIVFSASQVLKALDPIAYRCYLNDYQDMEEECHEG